MIRHPSKLSFIASGVITWLLILVFPNIQSFGQTGPQLFEDGKTIVSEIAFEGLDSDFEVDTPGLVGPIRESVARELFKDRSTGKLLNLPLNQIEVGKGIKTLKKWLFNQGYIDAEVTAYGEILSPGSMRVIYSVRRNEITKIREIRFSGNTRVSDQDLQIAFESSMRDSCRIYSPSRFEYIYHKFIRQDLLFKQGFFDASVRTERVQYQPDGIVVTVGIKEGPRYRNGKIMIEGNTVFERKQILEFLQWKPGEVSNGMQIRKAYTKH